MDLLKELSLGRRLVLVAGVLLFIDTFLDWQRVSIGVSGIVSVSAGQSAWHGFWGVGLGLLVVAIVLWVVAHALEIRLPANLPDGVVTLALGVLIPVFAILKALTDDYVHWPAYVGIVLAAAIAWGAWLVFAESGERLPHVTAGGTPS